MFTHAIVRTPGPDFADGLTTSGLGRPDHARMLVQHQAYVNALRTLGLSVQVLEPLPHHPDAYFVEDAAVVTPELAVITRPGAPARRGEAPALAPVLAAHKPTAAIHAPGTLDGGDVLIVGKRVFIGITGRTNIEGATQLGRLLEPQGFCWTPIPVGEGLHLKTFVNTLGGDTLLLAEAFLGHEAFAPYERLVVDPEEGYAANVLWINGHLLIPKGFPRTRDLLASRDLPLVELDCSEPRKMDGGLTCMSVRF